MRRHNPIKRIPIVCSCGKKVEYYKDLLKLAFFDTFADVFRTQPGQIPDSPLNKSPGPLSSF